MIEAFRLRGIYPYNVASLAEESLMWESAGDKEYEPLNPELVDQLAVGAKLLGSPVNRAPFMAPPSQTKTPKIHNIPYNPADPNHDEYGIDIVAAVKDELHAYAHATPLSSVSARATKLAYVDFTPRSGSARTANSSLKSSRSLHNVQARAKSNQNTARVNSAACPCAAARPSSPPLMAKSVTSSPSRSAPRSSVPTSANTPAKA